MRALLFTLLVSQVHLCMGSAEFQLLYIHDKVNDAIEVTGYTIAQPESPVACSNTSTIASGPFRDFPISFLIADGDGRGEIKTPDSTFPISAKPESGPACHRSWNEEFVEISCDVVLPDNINWDPAQSSCQREILGGLLHRAPQTASDSLPLSTTTTQETDGAALEKRLRNYCHTFAKSYLYNGVDNKVKTTIRQQVTQNLDCQTSSCTVGTSVGETITISETESLGIGPDSLGLSEAEGITDTSSYSCTVLKGHVGCVYQDLQAEMWLLAKDVTWRQCCNYFGVICDAAYLYQNPAPLVPYALPIPLSGDAYFCSTNCHSKGYDSYTVPYGLKKTIKSPYYLK